MDYAGLSSPLQLRTDLHKSDLHRFDLQRLPSLFFSAMVPDAGL